MEFAHLSNQSEDSVVEVTGSTLGETGACLMAFKMLPGSYRLDPLPGVLISSIVRGAVQGHITIDGHTHRLQGAVGSVCILSNNLAVQVELHSQMEIACLYLPRKFIDEVAACILPHHAGGVEIDNKLWVFDPITDILGRELSHAANNAAYLSPTYFDYLIRALAAHVVRSHRYAASGEPLLPVAEKPVNSRLFAQARSYIERHLAQRLTLEDIAAQTGIGPDQLGRQFKRITGTTLYQYVLLQRVQRAKQLLADTRKPIVEIALDCGFADQVHLTRVFRRMEQTTPAAYRQAQLSA